MLKEKMREKLEKGVEVDHSGNCKILESVVAANDHELLPPGRATKEKQEGRVTKDWTSALGQHRFDIR